MKRLLFTIYLLLYFRFAQYDVSGYWLSLVAGHFVEPWPWTMALVATGVLLLVLCLTEKLLAHWHKPVIVAYAIVAWLATAGVGMAFTTVWHQLLLAAGGLVLAWLLMITDKRLRHRSRITPQTFGVNFQFFAVQMLLLCLYVGVGNGVTDLQHYELRTAQALQSKHPKRAYKVGDKSYATSHRLFAMRCYLMATTQKKGLGNEAFSQMVPDGGAASLLLLPTDNYQQLLLPASKLEELLGSRRHANEGALAYLHRCAWLSAFKGDGKHTAAADYYLCALLLERKLDLFAREIVNYYPTEVAQSKLPRYFAQALILYQRTRTQPNVFYTDSNIEANYRDYTDMADSIPDRTVRTNMLRYSYGETYWWWYSYGGCHK
mgnify:FL=1